ncbi:MAG: hypothetical protein DMF23_15850 [Verrucomicrobia bacterium]|nr:MAG: hypothetical protein DMF23_15850 [Verrucomicrobiota bacterium]
MAITLTDLLDEKRVILGLRSRKMPNALREIIDLLAQNGKIDNPEAFFEKVLAREQAHPSVVENSAVLPHARTDLVLIFVIGVPERLVNDYLICVGTLVRLVRDDATRSALLHVQTPREFIDALTATL